MFLWIGRITEKITEPTVDVNHLKTDGETQLEQVRPELSKVVADEQVFRAKR
jgi:hypothetical protein